MVPAVCTSFMDFQKCKFSGSISLLLNNTLWSQGPAICLLASQVILKQSQQLKAVFELGQQQAMGHPPLCAHLSSLWANCIARFYLLFPLSPETLFRGQPFVVQGFIVSVCCLSFLVTCQFNPSISPQLCLSSVQLL